MGLWDCIPAVCAECYLPKPPRDVYVFEMANSIPTMTNAEHAGKIAGRGRGGVAETRLIPEQDLVLSRGGFARETAPNHGSS